MIWIAGILVHQHFRPGTCSFLLLLPTPALLAGSFLASKFKDGAARRRCPPGWSWGIAFMSMLMFAAVSTTSLHETKRSSEGFLSAYSRGWAERMRAKLAQPLSRLQISADGKALLSAVAIGSREALSREMKQGFSAAGVAHILSVSGFHIGVLCGFILLLTSILPDTTTGRIVRFFLTAVPLWTFAILTGLPPPTMRASVTLSFYLFGRLIERRSDGYNNLFGAAFIVLVCNPYDLFSVGFQLSYISVAGIIFFQPRIVSLIPLMNPLLLILWKSVALSVAAQFAVSFLCIHYFGQLSTIFLPANLYVGLLSTILIPSAMLFLLLPSNFPFHSSLERAIEILTENIVWTIDLLSRVPGATINLSLNKNSTLFCYAALLLSLYIFFSGDKKRRGR